MQTSCPIRIAADIGGTFTDIAYLATDGSLVTRKLPSTPDDFSRAVLDGINALIALRGLKREDVSTILHASTVATNAILEGKGARTALITTAGFRDVLELRRIRVPRLYDPLYQKPKPLVPRRDRHEANERMDARGTVLHALDLDEAHALVAGIAPSIDALAICFLHAYANPLHEAQLADIVRTSFPDLFVSVSHEVLPEIREYERTSTTVANAYVGPTVSAYLRALQGRLAEAGIEGRLLMMQSSGGTTDVQQAIDRPVQVIESGPAAGVVGAARIAVECGYPDVITFDMGGTTAKASLVEGGRFFSTDEYEVGGGISLSSRLVKGGGYAVKLPVIDVSEVGAGGGSIVRVDHAGLLKVGPESAGASPGPACYENGGERPTVTDANVVLGYINPRSLAGGAVSIDAGRARAALQADVAGPLGCDLLEAAYGVHHVANATMMRAVKAISTYRGRDPRAFALFAFGGNGGIHAVTLARALEMRLIIVPRGAGVFSAVGLLFTDLEALRSCAFLRPATEASLVGLVSNFHRLEAQVLAELDHPEDVQIGWQAEMRYAGQAFELPLAVPARDLVDEDLAMLQAAFAAEHERTYGYTLPDARIDFVTLRVRGAIPTRRAEPVARTATPLQAVAAARRPAYFGRAFGLLDTDVLRRGDVGPDWRQGPLIIEDYEGTTVVPPDARVRLDAHGNLVISL